MSSLVSLWTFRPTRRDTYILRLLLTITKISLALDQKLASLNENQTHNNNLLG